MKQINMKTMLKQKVELGAVIDFLVKKAGKRKALISVIDRDSDEKLSLTGLKKSHNMNAFLAEELVEVKDTREIIVYVRRNNCLCKEKK